MTPFNFNIVSTSIIMKKLKNQNTKKAIGYDGISITK